MDGNQTDILSIYYTSPWMVIKHTSYLSISPHHGRQSNTHLIYLLHLTMDGNQIHILSIYFTSPWMVIKHTSYLSITPHHGW
jgi:hypothetical protein